MYLDDIWLETSMILTMLSLLNAALSHLETKAVRLAS